jgi:hypothetical protein
MAVGGRVTAAGKWLVLLGFAVGLIAAAIDLLGLVPLFVELPILPTGVLGLTAVVLCLVGLALKGPRAFAIAGLVLGIVPWALVALGLAGIG